MHKRNCPHHQTWDFDCDTCVDVALQRIDNIRTSQTRELATLMRTAPSSH